VIPATPDASWAWNYVPVRALRSRYINVKLRNLSGHPNRIYFEFKHERQGLFGTPMHGTRKLLVSLAADDGWRIYQIPVPRRIRRPLNVIAFSDLQGPVELGSIALSDDPLHPAAQP
jgi:hypothetical protein